MGTAQLGLDERSLFIIFIFLLFPVFIFFLLPLVYTSSLCARYRCPIVHYIHYTRVEAILEASSIAHKYMS